MLEAVCDKLVVHTSIRIGKVQPAHRQRAMFVVSITNIVSSFWYCSRHPGTSGRKAFCTEVSRYLNVTFLNGHLF